MELAEVSSPCFSNWVHTSSARKLSQESWTQKKSRKTSRQNSRISTTVSLYYHRAKYTEEELKETLQRWVQNPEHEETLKLKKLVRQGVLPTLRSDLWTDASGGGDIILNSPHYYEEMIDDMGEKEFFTENRWLYKIKRQGWVGLFITFSCSLGLKKILVEFSYLISNSLIYKMNGIAAAIVNHLRDIMARLRDIQ